MRKPRLIYDNDARHYLTYRYDPPLSAHRLRQPVDEILGTGVDTLFYGFISQQTAPYKAKAGLYWLWTEREKSQVMWWRGGENLKQALEAGNDPLKVVVDRGHEHGMQVLTWLYWEPQDPDNEDVATYTDHADPEVRRRRLETIEEACDRYALDGIGLDYYVAPIVFSAEVPRPSSAPRNASALTGFVREVRELLDRIGGERGRQLCLTARVHPSEDANTEAGMDVKTWLSDKLVNMVIPTSPHPNSRQDTALFDTNPSLGWLVREAHAAGAWVYSPIVDALYDDRHYSASIEMYRAAATNLLAEGVDGVYLSGLNWPHTANEYQTLREMGYPEVFSRKSKHYVLGQGAASPGPHAAERQLPVTLEEGVPATATVFVGDSLDAARLDGELKQLTLGVRILQVCPEDRISFRFNGQELARESVRVETVYGGSISFTAQRGGLPLRITTYDWFEIDIPDEAVREGDNQTEVTLEYLHRDMSADRVLHAVELQVFYKEPMIPKGGQM